MHTPPIENLKIESQEHLPISGQGRVTRLEEVKVQLEEVKAQLEETKAQLEAAKDTVGRHKAKIGAQEATIRRLRGSRDKYLKGYQSTRERAEQSKRENGQLREAYEAALKKRNQRIRAVEGEHALTKELLAARTTELSGAQSFLSTIDRLSDTEVLGIVRDLNENIFQVAANLTEEWERLEPSRSAEFKPTKEDINGFSAFYGTALVHQVLERVPSAVTFLIQSCLCHFATQITTSWRHNRDTEYMILGSVYRGLCASEGQPISTRWRSLTHDHLPEPVSHSASLAQFVAEVLWLTGTFSSNRRSFDFVKAKAFMGIDTIDRLATRLESVFMVDITSGDANLLVADPNSEFNDASMSLEFESDVSATSRRRDKVAGTTEVGVEKRVGKRGEGFQTKVLLKAKVVLEKDLVGS